MKPNTYRLFAQLCESITESSTTMNLITGHPGGTQVVKQLHKDKDMRLVHNLEYQEVKQIRWSELKDMRGVGWVIMRCTNGTAAIRSYGGYEALVSDGGETKSFDSSNGAQVMNFINSEVGKPTNFFVAVGNLSQINDLRDKRLKQKPKSLQARYVSPEQLLKKFQPLFAKVVTAAIADIKGHVTTMIKNDAFHKVEKKLKRLKLLQDILTSLESNITPPDSMMINAIISAVMMTASYYYPEETGEITKTHYNYRVERDKGMDKVLDDISNGDTNKLGTVLRFFKRALVTV